MLYKFGKLTSFIFQPPVKGDVSRRNEIFLELKNKLTRSGIHFILNQTSKSGKIKFPTLAKLYQAGKNLCD